MKVNRLVYKSIRMDVRFLSPFCNKRVSQLNINLEIKWLVINENDGQIIGIFQALFHNILKVIYSLALKENLLKISMKKTSKTW